MGKQAIIPLAIGLVVGLVAVKLGYDYLKKLKSSQVVSSGPVEKVVTASRDLPVGTKLQQQHLKVADMPKDLVPNQAVSDPKELIGQTIKVSLAKKLPVLKSMTGPGEGLGGVIPDGYRAMSVQVDEFTGVAGLLEPKDRVDVLATFKIRTIKGRTSYVSKTVLQDVEVRAIGQRFRETNDDGPVSKISRSVTLLIKPADVEDLQFAASVGEIRLALRAPFDGMPSRAKGLMLDELLTRHRSDVGTELASGWWNKLFSLASHETEGEEIEAGEGNGQVVHRPQAHIVEVLAGERVERVFFASADSDQRVDPQDIDLFDTSSDPADNTDDIQIEDLSKEIE